MGIIVAIICGFLYAEVVGYWLHRLLHSEKFPTLSRAHMEHHLREYGPKMRQRSDNYKKAERPGVGGIGFEWLAPIFIILSVTLGVLWPMGMSWWSILVFSVAGISWGIFMLSYMHDVLHLQNTWFARGRLRRWFLKVRRLHDIHHIHLTDEGKMNVNYGICFFGMDRLFGTFKKRIRGFNEVGYNASKTTYDYIYDGR